MDLQKLRKEFEDACFNGDLISLKKIIKKYPGNDLELNPHNSEALSWAFRRKHFDIVEYLLTSPEMKQDLKIPSSIIDNLIKYNKSITEYICENEKIKFKVNFFKNNEQFGKILKGACEYGLEQSIEKLVTAKESKGFWKEKLIGLNILAKQEKSNVKIFNLIVEQILNNKKIDKNLVDENLKSCLFTGLDNSNINLATYLVFDRNLQITENDKEILKSYYKEGNNLFLMREINKSLNETLNINTTSVKRSHKL